MKFKGKIYIKCYFECIYCGKVYQGEENKMNRRLLIHMFTHHPIKSFKILFKLITDRRKQNDTTGSN